MTEGEHQYNDMCEKMLKLGKEDGLRYFVYHPPSVVFERFGSEIEARAHIEGVAPDWAILRAEYYEDGRPKGLVLVATSPSAKLW